MTDETGFPAEIEARHEDRFRLNDAEAAFRVPPARGSVLVRDLSTGGFATEWHYPLLPDDRVWITLPGLESRPATVVWAESFAIGCRFDSPLHAAVLGNLVARFG